MAVVTDTELSNNNSTEVEYRFAAEQSSDVTKIVLDLKLAAERLPLLSVEPIGAFSAEPELKQQDEAGLYSVQFFVRPPADPNRDDEVRFVVRGHAVGDAPPIKVHLRRSTCQIGLALVERHQKDLPVRASTQAALLWQGWNRYQDIVGLKRFTSGKSGSDVLVFRPRLIDPLKDDHGLEEIPRGAISKSWGSCLLVKSGPVKKIREEWERFQVFLKDRMHPFMSRPEVCLHIRPDERLKERFEEKSPREIPSSVHQDVTIIGSFLGGDIVQAESFERFVQGSSDPERCKTILNKLFELMATWYEGSTTRPLREWYKVFRNHESGQPLRLFGAFDLNTKGGRAQYRRGLAWDVPFGKEEHLRDHLLGKCGSESGLLFQLMEMPVRFSLVHGDLHTLNILADEDNVWLLDFGEVCVAPTLFDFAKLEVYLRYWGLKMRPQIRNFEDAAFRFENLLLDNMTGSEGGLEEVTELADSLGVDPIECAKVAECINTIRRHALRYSEGAPDRRDYLAVVYLTTLQTLRYAGYDPSLLGNCRLLVSLAWVLEDFLSRLMGMNPVDRRRKAFDSRSLVSRSFVSQPGTPGRIEYVMNSGPDQVALEPLLATRGVLQNDNHHLDVYEHTLLVLAFIERLSEDPIRGFSDPGRLEERVVKDLKDQGIQISLGQMGSTAEQMVPFIGLKYYVDDLENLFQDFLPPEVMEGLKWGALLHDVGKPATRCLSLNSRGESMVQFLGHEVHGHVLAKEHLKEIFGPDEKIQREVAEYIVLYHHNHHQLVNGFLPVRNDKPGDLKRKKERLDRLRRFVDSGFQFQWDKGLESDLFFLKKYFDTDLAASNSRSATDKQDELALAARKYFPLIILHGFCDALACRGIGATSQFHKIAEIDLLLLVLYCHFPKIEYLWTTPDELTKGLCEQVNVKGRQCGVLIERLKQYCRDYIIKHWGNKDFSLTREDIVHKAEELVQEQVEQEN